MSTLNVNQIVDASGGVLAPISSVMRNRIINGAMVIDQRNAGASISVGSSPVYPVDRFQVRIAQGSGHTTQRSTTAPAGFINSTLITVGTGASPTSGQVSIFNQQIEGFNMADLGWGTASAQAVTISFKVRSSVTGTYSVAMSNNGLDRSYVTTFTINAANTFEDKSVTIPGDTSGTWLKDNGIGAFVFFDLGSGTNREATAGLWVSSWSTRTSGSVQLSATSGATFYITGVQLEKGTQATSFEYRQYGTELALCQRYYETTRFPAATFTQAATRTCVISSANNNIGGNNSNFVVPKRVAPTVTLFSRNNTSGQVSLVSSGLDFAGSATANQINPMGFSNIILANNATSGALIEVGYVADAEL